MTDLRGILRAGMVRRWAINPDMCHVVDPVDHHECRVAKIILALWPECTGELLKAALTHDDGEQGAWGDVSAPAKKRMSKLAREEMEDAEFRARYLLWGRDFIISKDERKRLQFADKLDAFMMVQRRRPDILDGDGWPEAREWLRANAISLGVADKVAGVVG